MPSAQHSGIPLRLRSEQGGDELSFLIIEKTGQGGGKLSFMIIGDVLSDF